VVGLPDVTPLGPRDPRMVGHYRLLGLLGKGGMSSVYLARRGADPDGRPGHGGSAPYVAVKLIDEDLARVPAFRERFRREAHAARRVARFCTAEVLDLDVAAPRPYLVTEYIDGPTLGAAVETRGPLPPAELERFAVSVVSALTAIHAAGVVHRDLKPGNIMLSRSGWRVIDFGICRPLEDATVITVGRLGTPVFMAPEQARDLPATTATDVHAWGAIMVYAATGRPPFGDPPIPELLRRVMHEPPELAGLPGLLRPVVARALAKDPAQRPAARELLLRLTDVTPYAADPAADAPVTDEARPDKESTQQLPINATLLPLPPHPGERRAGAADTPGEPPAAANPTAPRPAAPHSAAARAWNWTRPWVRRLPDRRRHRF
jgi:serine/threonine protein kinase